MKNFEVYLKNPKTFELLNNGVSKVTEMTGDQDQLKTLRFELETFVCDGEYARGIERILSAYLSGLNKPEQQAAWVSGFFGSGKSHLVKMLRYLWVDFTFPDGASARSIVNLPSSVHDLFVELTNRGRMYGGLRAAAGTLGDGSMENVRLAFLQLIFRAASLPENIAAARFVIWLREKGIFDSIVASLSARNLSPEKEFRNFFVSTLLAESLVQADASFGTPQNAQAAIRTQFPIKTTPTVDETVDLIRSIFGDNGRMPLTLLVVDEIQQYIGDRVQQAMDVQQIAEHCATDFHSRLLLVGTGQSALAATPNLQRLQARFTVKVPLSDSDVENVIRKTVLAKKPEKLADIQKVIDAHQGEISRHLHNTRLATMSSDAAIYAADYPLLPVRLRFWEKVLRNVDASGTTAQLRTQLGIVFDAARATSDQSLGHVVPGDFIYDQKASDLLNTGILPRQYHETIMALRDNTPEGTLKSRLCALMFLIAQLPRTGGADDGVRSDTDTLADLLIQDLQKDSASLRKDIPTLLDELVTQGKAMLVENEYRLQTPEGADWLHDFKTRRNRILNDEPRIGTAREQELQTALGKALRPLVLSQGVSRQPRDMELVLSSAMPAQPAQKLVLWVRHGWADQEKTVLTDARTAGNESPMLFCFLPRSAVHEDLRQNLASSLAAGETLEHKGTPNGPEAIEACNAIKTQQQLADLEVQKYLRQILAEAKVFQGGGSEGSGVELVDKVSDAAKDALQRLFPRFNEADSANWGQVLQGARSGNVGALQAVNYRGETDRHPACKQIYDLIGPGKKGKDVRDNFKGEPFGWPQDAIDAALVMLTLSGNLRASINGQPATAAALNQTQISGAVFYVDVPPLTVTQRLDLKALFQKLDVSTPSGQEPAAAAAFLEKLLVLADGAGGDSPKPEKPDISSIKDLQGLSGNAQLAAIHDRKDGISESIILWGKAKAEIAKRHPCWQRLQDLHALAVGLPEAAEIGQSLEAIMASRGLLLEPDPVPPLIKKLLEALRRTLNGIQTSLVETYQREMIALEANSIWQRLEKETQHALIERFQLQPPTPIKLASEADILAALKESSLNGRRTLVEAMPQRFQKALEEAARLLEPKATRVALPAATIHDEKELDTWIDEVRDTIKDYLKEGPVIL
ncbi:MAG: BREX system P-loop protein BrxC [Proteobacteria bacterium]|nr:BREX system P-loop protein BrxC [Pseudomonadota bacterium]MBU4582016.1 BREX system P-loop protein BrxC [Pseudomonadota bacterium]MCG2739617.1 BREX system P-loop protein BrxC [Syntrophaceae bacterium]